MRILAFDISKRATGIAYVNEFLITPTPLGVIKFENSIQWENEIKKTITACKPEIIVFSDFAKRFMGGTSGATLAILYGLFYHLQHIAFEMNINIVFVNEATAFKLINYQTGRLKRPEKKRITKEWAEDINKSRVSEDEADAMMFVNWAQQTLITVQ